MKLLTLLILSAFVISHSAFAAKPNVVIIVSDDMNCALGCYGHPQVKSPHLDKLAATGVRFERAYCQFPLCNPSRSSLFSGRWPATTKVLNNTEKANVLLKDFKLMPQFFREHGYITSRIGKILHDGMDIADLWDMAEEAPSKDKTEIQAQRHAGENNAAKAKKGAVEKTAAEAFLWAKSDAAPEQTGDGQKALRAVEQMKSFAASEKPFFLAIGFRKPHHAYVAPAKYFDLYPPESITWPEESPEHIKDISADALTAVPGSKGMTKQERQQIIAAYYACISLVDEQVGRVLAGLEENKLANNTIVIFLGDHGYHLGEHAHAEGAMWHKMSLFDLSARAPLIVRMPGIAGNGTASPRAVQFMDLYPTVVELCGLDSPPPLDGHSLVPLLRDTQAAWDHPAYTFLMNGRIRHGVAVSSGSYRYIEWERGDQGRQLYDVQSDPQEQRNLISDPAHADTITKMKALLKDVPLPF